MSLERLRYWLDRLTHLTWKEGFTLAVPILVVMFIVIMALPGGEDADRPPHPSDIQPSRATLEPRPERVRSEPAPSSDNRSPAQPLQPAPSNDDVVERLQQLQVSYSACETFFNAFRLAMDELLTVINDQVTPAADDVHLVIFAGRLSGSCFVSHHDDFAPWLDAEGEAIAAHLSQSDWETIRAATKVAGEVGAELVAEMDIFESEMLELGFIRERR